MTESNCQPVARCRMQGETGCTCRCRLSAPAAYSISQKAIQRHGYGEEAQRSHFEQTPSQSYYAIKDCYFHLLLDVLTKEKYISTLISPHMTLSSGVLWTSQSNIEQFPKEGFSSDGTKRKTCCQIPLYHLTVRVSETECVRYCRCVGGAGMGIG